jgi:3-isopropylmalate/(R)-2-methylmalate dehydratase small subunit
MQRSRSLLGEPGDRRGLGFKGRNNRPKGSDGLKVKGRVFKYGNDVNTDVIFPGKYTYTITNPKQMAEHALEDLDPEFKSKVKPGDVIIAGKNFGCGSSREQAVTCIKQAGVGAIIAESFARIYYRNAINGGLPAITTPKALEIGENGQELEIDLEKGQVKNLSTKKTFEFQPLPEFVMELIKQGGLIPSLKKKVKKNAKT